MPAGYSGTPLPKKLGIKSGSRVASFGAPPGFAASLGPLPEGVRWVKRGGYDLGLLFCADAAQLRRVLPAAQRRMAAAGALWLAWPKKASGVATDLGDGAVRAAGLAAGLVDVKVCAIDEVWSGLKFVIPVRDRPKA